MNTVRIPYDKKIEDSDFNLDNLNIVYINKYTQFYIMGDKANCKSCYLTWVTSCLYEENIEIFVKRLKECLEEDEKLFFQLDVTHLHLINNLSRYFKLLYCMKLPFGYDGDYQYHAMFLTEHYKGYNYTHYESRLEEEGIELIK